MKFNNLNMNKINCLLIISSLYLFSCQHNSFNQREQKSLNGTWNIEESTKQTDIPQKWSRTIEVPGIVDMAIPAFDSAGLHYSKRNYYWYKKTFTIDRAEMPQVVLLKINKSKYGTTVFLNGKEIGSNLWCNTPSYFNIHDFVKCGEPNELLVRLGATEFDIPDSIPNDRTDLEKKRRFAGIYDEVNLILSNYPFIENIQIAPDIEKKQIRVIAQIRSDKTGESMTLKYRVNEYRSGKKVTSGTVAALTLTKGSDNKIDFTIPIKDCQQWSPENPFLYNVSLSTGKDSKTERFGMRSFKFDSKRGMAILNGKPYAMLGTNVCIFRFFEDSERGNLPWNKTWVTKLHQSFKSMNWNCIRYSLGFPPEIWYEAADETGMLIQDEYLFWYQYGVKASALATEYEKWMRERWNHPCVVIWDAQNETISKETGIAIDKVRGLDLSDRPWDNGYSAPRKESDCIESHPYLFYNFCNGRIPSKYGYLKDLFDTVRNPFNDPNEHDPKSSGRYTNAVVINEYDWLWLNRDGSPTTLTDKVYSTLFGENITPEERQKIRAENVAILTEYWRCHRKCAALMHFCGLGYSRPFTPRGQTCDIFTDVKNLIIEPNLLKTLKPKFAPICLMIDKWEKSFSPGENLQVPVDIINDLPINWMGNVNLEIRDGIKTLTSQSVKIQIPDFGKHIETFQIKIPDQLKTYSLRAFVVYKNDTLESIRHFTIKGK